MQVENGLDAVERLREYMVPKAERGIGYLVNHPEGSPQFTGVFLVKELVERLEKGSVEFLPGLVILILSSKRVEF